MCHMGKWLLFQRLWRNRRNNKICRTHEKIPNEANNENWICSMRMQFSILNNIKMFGKMKRSEGNDESFNRIASKNFHPKCKFNYFVRCWTSSNFSFCILYAEKSNGVAKIIDMWKVCTVQILKRVQRRFDKMNFTKQNTKN